MTCIRAENQCGGPSYEHISQPNLPPNIFVWIKGLKESCTLSFVDKRAAYICDRYRNCADPELTQGVLELLQYTLLVQKLLWSLRAAHPLQNMLMPTKALI